MSKHKPKAKPLGPVGKNYPERIVLGLNQSFCSDVPAEARAGSFDVPSDHDRFGHHYDVPDGVYRVEGSDWLFTFAKKKLANVTRAAAENDFGGDKVIVVSTQWLTPTN